MDRCRTKITCRKCKGKDHGTKFCTSTNPAEPKCTYCRKGKHTTENCRARKKAEKEAQSRTGMVASDTASILSSTAPTQSLAPQIPSTSRQSSVPMPVLDSTATPLSITERLQLIANGVNVSDLLTMEGPRPSSYSTAGSSHSIPTSAPGMYGHGNQPGWAWKSAWSPVYYIKCITRAK